MEEAYWDCGMEGNYGSPEPELAPVASSPVVALLTGIEDEVQFGMPLSKRARFAHVGLSSFVSSDLLSMASESRFTLNQITESLSRDVREGRVQRLSDAHSRSSKDGAKLISRQRIFVAAVALTHAHNARYQNTASELSPSPVINGLFANCQVSLVPDGESDVRIVRVEP